MKDFIARVGTFFILVGIGLTVLFVASDASVEFTGKRADYSLLCIAIALFMMGFLFRRTATPPQAAERFRYVKKIQERREAAKKEKLKAQQQKK